MDGIRIAQLYDRATGFAGGITVSFGRIPLSLSTNRQLPVVNENVTVICYTSHWYQIRYQ